MIDIAPEGAPGEAVEAVTRRGSSQSLQVFARVSEVQGVYLFGHVQSPSQFVTVEYMYIAVVAWLFMHTQQPMCMICMPPPRDSIWRRNRHCASGDSSNH